MRRGNIEENLKTEENERSEDGQDVNEDYSDEKCRYDNEKE